MKKFLSLVLALILGIIGTNVPAAMADVATKTDVTYSVDFDTPDAVKADEWLAGYKMRCRRYRRHTSRQKKQHKLLKKVLLAPLTLFIGVAGAEPASASSHVNQMQVSYVTKDEAGKKLVKSKHYPVSSDAKKAYDILAKMKYPCAMHWDTGKGKIFCQAANGWKLGDEKEVAEEPLSILNGKYVEHNRAVLNPNFGPADQNLWLFDTVRKQVPTTEEIICDLLGGEVLFVESAIPEWGSENGNDLSARDIAETKQAEWKRAINEGLLVNGVLYKPLGHGTNAAKEDKTVWCTATIRDRAFAILKKVDPDWKTTAAKGVAYTFGLQNVTPKVWLDLPIKPEDFAWFDEIKEPVLANIAECKDGDVCYVKGGKTAPISKADGQLLVHVSEKKKQEWINKKIAEGMGRRAARHLVESQISMLHNSFSARTRNAALKFSAMWFDFHQAWKDETGSNMVHGNIDIDDIVFIGDSSVRKTSVGNKSGCAFKSEQAWCDAVRTDELGKGFQLGILIQEDHLKVKDLPYQFLQHLYGAKEETINAIIKKMIGKIRELHTMDGLLKYVGKELRFILKRVPLLASFPLIQKKLESVFYKRIDNILSGKYLEAGLYGQMHADPVYQLQSYMKQDGFCIEVTGSLEADTIYIVGDTTPENEGEEGVAYRSPIATTGALKVIKTAIPSEKYRKYYEGCGPCMVFNCKDDTVTQMAGDYDGDHNGVCKDKVIVKAVKEAQAKYGTWLPVSEAPNPEKGLFTIEAMEEYMKGLTKPSDLGKTMIEIVKILNGIKTIWKDGKPWKRVTFEPSVNALMSDADAGLNQVDASKHGNKTQKKHPDCYDQGPDGCLPMTKVYRNAIKNAKGRPDRSVLDSIKPEPESLCVGVLNKYFRGIKTGADCKFSIYDMPEAEKAWKAEYVPIVLKAIMQKPERSRRGMSGLTRVGTYNKLFGYAPDQGLLESLARRSQATWQAIVQSDDGNRRMSHKDFVALKREQGLNELTKFAEACGRTLDDACDVIIWQDIEFIESNYPDGKDIDEILKRNVWETSWDILGGILVEHTKENVEDFDISDVDLDIDDLEDDFDE